MDNKEQITAMQLQVTSLEQKIELMRKLRTFDGFHSYFFSQIDKFKNRKECFDYCNQLFFDLFGEYRYSEYVYFRKAISKNRKFK